MQDPRDLRVVELAREFSHQLDDVLGCRGVLATPQSHDLALRHRAALPHDPHAMALVLGAQLHLVDQCAQESLAIPSRRRRRAPDRLEVLAERLRSRQLVGRQRTSLLAHPGRLGAHRLQLLQPLVPAPLQLARDGPVLRLDRHVLPLGPLHLVLGLLDLQPPGLLGYVDLLAQLLAGQRGRLGAGLGRDRKERLDHRRLDPLASDELTLGVGDL
jgi:hypothetical protein